MLHTAELPTKEGLKVKVESVMDLTKAKSKGIDVVTVVNDYFSDE